MSTSTISSVMIQIFYLFSGFKNPNFSNISDSYENEPKKYMISQRKPITNYLSRIPGEKELWVIIESIIFIKAFDSDKGYFNYSNTILMELGKILERSITMKGDTFKKVLLKESHPDFKPEYA